MTSIGQLKTGEPIEKAIRIIRDWLIKINVPPMSINTNYDPRINIALIKFKYKDKDYEFRSTKQSNCRLNMWGIARVMEYKVRASYGIGEHAQLAYRLVIHSHHRERYFLSQPLECSFIDTCGDTMSLSVSEVDRWA